MMMHRYVACIYASHLGACTCIYIYIDGILAFDDDDDDDDAHVFNFICLIACDMTDVRR